jgi:hypothetical protein
MLELARRGEVPDLPDRGLPEYTEIRAVLDRALCADPASRFQTPAECLDALDKYARATSQMASQLKFGSFLTDHFADEIVALRRARERAAVDALNARGMSVSEIEPVTLPSEPPVTRPSAPHEHDAEIPRRRLSDQALSAHATQPNEHFVQRPKAPLLWASALLLLASAAVAFWLGG